MLGCRDKKSLRVIETAYAELLRANGFDVAEIRRAFG